LPPNRPIPKDPKPLPNQVAHLERRAAIPGVLLLRLQQRIVAVVEDQSRHDDPLGDLRPVNTAAVRKSDLLRIREQRALQYAVDPGGEEVDELDVWAFVARARKHGARE
jgi:hypothetical protein